MFDILILISLFVVINAISALISEWKKRIRAKRKLEKFEMMSPPKKHENG